VASGPGRSSEKCKRGNCALGRCVCRKEGQGGGGTDEDDAASPEYQSLIKQLRQLMPDCPGPPGRLSALSVSHSKAVFYGAFAWARGALRRPFRRSPGPRAAACLVHCLLLQTVTSPRSTTLNGGLRRPGAVRDLVLESSLSQPAGAQSFASPKVRKTPSWPRSWANFRLS
jgi:hypothetical protein